MIFNSNKFKIVFVYSISLLLTLIVFFLLGKQMHPIQPQK